MTLRELLDYKLVVISDYFITPLHITKVILLVFICWIIIFISRRIIKRQIKTGRFDEGRGEAFSQILSYIIVLIAILAGQ